MKNKLQAEIANALWAYYEYALPDTPWRMAGVIVKELRLKGLAEEEKP